LANLAANVAVTQPTSAGRVIAAWPSFALIGAYELLMRQVRHGAEAWGQVTLAWPRRIRSAASAASSQALFRRTCGRASYAARRPCPRGMWSSQRGCAGGVAVPARRPDWDHPARCREERGDPMPGQRLISRRPRAVIAGPARHAGLTGSPNAPRWHDAGSRPLGTCRVG
jgi:hypothetical protein